MDKEIKSTALIFDMDGTLLDSLYYWRNMDKFSSLAFNFEQNTNITLGELSGSFFEKITKYVNLHGFNHNVDTVKEELYRVGLDYYKREVTIKKHAIDFIEFALSLGKRICIATATNGSIAKQVLKHLEILHYFEFVLSTDDVGVGKSHPDIYLKAIDLLNTDIHNTIVFEDNCKCVQTAKKAGFRVAGILDRNFTKEENEKTKQIADWYSWDYTYYLELFKNR